jgi:hypothetical protein
LEKNEPALDNVNAVAMTRSINDMALLEEIFLTCR